MEVKEIKVVNGSPQVIMKRMPRKVNEDKPKPRMCKCYQNTRKVKVGYKKYRCCSCKKTWMET